MYYTRTAAINLYHRLDSLFYNPDAVATERLLSTFGSVSPLKEIVDPARPISNGVRGPDLQPSNCRLIRLQDCDGWWINFDRCLTISEAQFHQNRRCVVKDGDVIVAIGGYIGLASLAHNVKPAVIGQHSALLSRNPVGSTDPAYLVAYLNCRIGAIQWGVTRRPLKRRPSFCRGRGVFVLVRCGI